MVGISQDSKHGQGDIDGGDSKISRPSPGKSRPGEWTTSRRELWCFYLYYVVRTLFHKILTISYRCQKGNNGLPGFSLGPSQFQNLLYLAGYDPTYPPFTEPCSNEANCVLSYLGRTRDGLLSRLSSLFGLALDLLMNRLLPFSLLSSSMCSQFDYPPHKWN